MSAAGLRRARWIVAAMACAVLVWTAGLRAQARDEWRARAVASFDEAWQTVADTFYDSTFGGVDWTAVRRELRPQVEAAQSPEAARGVIRAMLARLHASHLAVLTSEPDAETLPGEASAPIETRVLDAGVVVVAVRGESPAADRAGRSGVRAGDRIVEIDGQPIAAWQEHAEGADARARRLDVWKRVFRALHGAPGSSARLTVEHSDGQTAAIEMIRVADAGDLVRVGNLPPMHVRTTVEERRTAGGRRAGVVAFNVWMAAVAEPFAAAIDRFRQADGFVIDLRGNTGGLADLIRGLAGHLVNDPILLGRMHMRAVDLEFRANPRRSTADGRTVEPYGGPVAVLVDELTASASECFAGGLQSAGRVRVFGVPTMGQALPAATLVLPDGDLLIHAVGDFVTSTGQRLEGQGVIPDETVPLTIPDLAAGRDPVMDRALAWFDRQASVR